MRRLQRLPEALAVLSLGCLLTTSALADDTVLNMATVEAGSQAAIFMTTVAEIASANVDGVQIDVFPDGTDTMDTMFLSRGVLDLSMISPVTHDLMTEGEAMLAHETVAAELSEAAQLLLWFPRGRFHFAVRADSEIGTLDDIAGARMHLGPPEFSSDYYEAASWIEATTGLIAGQDYEPVTNDWSDGTEDFLAGDVDVFVHVCLDPCLRLEVLSAETDLRFLGPLHTGATLADGFFQPGRTRVAIEANMSGGQRSGEQSPPSKPWRALLRTTTRTLSWSTISFQPIGKIWIRGPEIEPPPLKWSASIVRKAEDQEWPLRDPSRKRLS